MRKNRNLTAKDLSEKFGISVSENDLTPDMDKDSKYVNMPADAEQLEDFAIGGMNQPLPKKTDASQKHEEEVKPAEEPTFAQLFEARNQHVSDKPAENPEPVVRKPAAPVRMKGNKLVAYSDDELDFGAMLRSHRSPIPDKDKVEVSDEKFKPIEISEEVSAKISKKTFSGFEDLANAFGRKGKK